MLKVGEIGFLIFRDDPRRQRVTRKRGITVKVKDSFALTTDFEKALINSSNRYLKPQHSKGCFFHYLQLLWRHAGLEHLKTNQLMKLTSIMITGLTPLAFISEDKVIIAFEKLRSYILNQVKDVTSYTAFFEYYENNWIYGIYR